MLECFEFQAPEIFRIKTEAAPYVSIYEIRLFNSVCKGNLMIIEFRVIQTHIVLTLEYNVVANIANTNAITKWKALSFQSFQVQWQFTSKYTVRE